MIDVYSFHEGTVPLLVSVPHDGCHLPPDLKGRMTPAALQLPDTDWHVAELYSFVRELGASLLVANYSRYVVDLNRPATDEALYAGQVATGLCPVQTFAGEDIYRAGAPDAAEVAQRIATYWRPYHDKIESTLASIREKHGYALLWDAHSIASRVPRLFDGELPELNIGTNDGRSCSPEVEDAVVAAARGKDFGHILNGRFKGGYITRHFGAPARGLHAVQLEIAQRVYMDELTGVYDAAKAAHLRATLRDMLQAFLDTAEKL